jgi:hypothetical protein
MPMGGLVNKSFVKDQNLNGSFIMARKSTFRAPNVKQPKVEADFGLQRFQNNRS